MLHFIGICHVECVLLYRVKGEDVRLMLWDTAGQEEFDAITKAYYRGELTHLLWLYIIYMYILKVICATCKFMELMYH